MGPAGVMRRGSSPGGLLTVKLLPLLPGRWLLSSGQLRTGLLPGQARVGCKGVSWFVLVLWTKRHRLHSEFGAAALEQALRGGAHLSYGRGRRHRDFWCPVPSQGFEELGALWAGDGTHDARTTRAPMNRAREGRSVSGGGAHNMRHDRTRQPGRIVRGTHGLDGESASTDRPKRIPARVAPASEVGP